MTSASHETTQSIDLQHVFDSCIKELDNLCNYYNNNTVAIKFPWADNSLPTEKLFCARYLIAEYLRILFYAFKEIETSKASLPLSKELITFVITTIAAATSILKKPFPITLHQIEIIIDAATWMIARLEGASPNLFQTSLPSQAGLLAGNKTEPGFEYVINDSHRTSIFQGLKTGRLKEFFTTYQKIYKTCANPFIFPAELSEALVWFLHHSQAMNYLPSIQQNAGALYIRASSAGNVPHSETFMDEQTLKTNKALTRETVAVFIILGVIFPPLIVFNTNPIIAEDAYRRAERAIKLLLEPKTTAELWSTVFARSRHPNRKSTIFALSVAILWGFAQARCGVGPISNYLSPALKAFADKLAPYARDLIAVAAQNYIKINVLENSQCQLREGWSSDDDTSENSSISCRPSSVL